MKLDLDLVPASCWFTNVRSEVSEKDWNMIRKDAYKKANYVCEICGGVGKFHPVEAHEIWNYDEKNLIQKLVGIKAICPLCHACHHFGLAQIQGKEKETLSHFVKINKVSKKEALSHIELKFKEWQHRSTLQWSLDISYLERYGINVKEIKKR